MRKKHEFFIGYKNYDHKIKLLPVMFPKTSTYVGSYDGETKRMYFLLKMMSY